MYCLLRRAGFGGSRRRTYDCGCIVQRLDDDTWDIYGSISDSELTEGPRRGQRKGMGAEEVGESPLEEVGCRRTRGIWKLSRPGGRTRQSGNHVVDEWVRRSNRRPYKESYP